MSSPPSYTFGRAPSRREARAERTLRRIRANPALFGELGVDKEAQAARIRDRCKAILQPMWNERHEDVQEAKGDRFMRLMT